MPLRLRQKVQKMLRRDRLNPKHVHRGLHRMPYGQTILRHRRLCLDARTTLYSGPSRRTRKRRCFTMGIAQVCWVG